MYVSSYCESVNSHIPQIFPGGLVCARHHARCEDFSGGCNGEKAHTQQVGVVEGVAGMPVQTWSQWASLQKLIFTLRTTF